MNGQYVEGYKLEATRLFTTKSSLRENPGNFSETYMSV